MKSFFVKILVTTLLAVSFFVTTPASVEAASEISIVIDKEEIVFNQNSGSPFIDNANRTQVPLRITMEAYGCKVTWDNDSKTAIVEKDNITVEVPIGQSYILVNNVKRMNDTAALIKDNRTYLPIRIVLEAFGAEVNWKASQKQVEVLSTNENLTTSEIAINADSIVMLECKNHAGTSLGSGVIIGTNGEIVTNYHVIEGASKINITFNDGSNYTGSVYVNDYDSEMDLAVLKISKTGLKAVTIGDSQTLVVGEQVVAIGSPYGFFNTVTEGIISSIRTGLLQISAAISPGSSGGGLFNSRGELIGITSSGVQEAENLGFAIPVELLQEVSGRSNMSLTTFSSLTSASNQIAQKINPPQNIRLVNETYDKAYINWTPVDGADYYYFYYQKQGDGTYWYDEENGQKTKYYYSNGYSVEYYGLTPGTTYNVIVTSVKDGIESDDSKALSFIKGYGSSTIFYLEHYGVPDFGKIAGCFPVQSGDGIYVYDIFSYDVEDLRNYYKNLEIYGFKYIGDYTNRDGFTILAYGNRTLGVAVQVGLAKISGITYGIITIDKLP